MADIQLRKTREFTADQARQFWLEVRKRVAIGIFKFSEEYFPEDPDGSGFQGLVFQGNADFCGVEFGGNVNFREARFEGDADFCGATFEGNADFRAAMFEKDADFRGATFERRAYFTYAAANGNAVSFSRSRFLWERGPFKEAADGRIPYRLAKQTAQNRGDYYQAGLYHFAEQCAINSEKRKSATKHWWPLVRLRAWGAFVIIRLVFGYGEKPARPLAVGSLVIIVWTGVLPQLEVEDPGL